MRRKQLTQPLAQFLSAGVLLAAAFITTEAWSREDWSQDLSARQRFTVYPHVDAGFRALDQKHFDSAIKEFQRATELAPDRPALVGYLAETYAEAGDPNKAIVLIDTQLKKTPDNQKLTQARQVYSQRVANDLIARAESLKNNPTELRRFLANNRPKLETIHAESVWLNLMASVSTPTDNLLVRYTPKFIDNKVLKERLSLLMLLRNDAQQQANQLIDQWPASALTKTTLVDGLSYQLLNNGNADQALRLLIRAYPFTQASPAERDRLYTRMVIAESRAKDRTLMTAFLADREKHLDTSAQEREWLTLASAAYGDNITPLARHPLQFQDNANVLESEVQRRLGAGADLPRDVSWTTSIAQLGNVGDPLLDALTYRMVSSGQNAAAWHLLMTRYPFEGMSSSLRENLVSRMELIATREPSLLERNERSRLSTPLETTGLRRLQASMLNRVGDCAGVRAVLGDLSDRYTATEWLMLGECYQRQQRSGLAQYAFEQALRLHPTPETERALAYVAFQNKDNKLAVDAWEKVVAAGAMSTDNWLSAAVTALAAEDKDQAAQWLNEYERAKGVQSAEYWTVKARVVGDNDVSAAIQAMKRSIEIAPLSNKYIELAGWQRKAGDQQGAMASLQTAIALTPSDGAARADLGFLEYSLGDLPGSQVQMEAALKLRPNDTRVIEQLAYIDQRLGENEQSKHYIELSVDHLMRYPPEEQTLAHTESLFALRRMHEDLSRRWTLSLDAMSGTSPAASVQSPVPGQNFKSYSQIEFDYRLGDPAIRNGKTVSIYARVFGGSGPQNSALPIYAPMLGVGLRWKPFSDHVFYLAAEKQIPLDQGTSAPANTMLRASASFLNSGAYSDDWHPAGPGWFSQNLYLDSAYYLSNQAYALTADYRFGYHHKLEQGQTIEPYTRFLANKISGETSPDIRVGAGVRWNLWTNQSRYSAYANRYYVGLELQGAIKTYQNDRFTALVTMGVRW